MSNSPAADHTLLAEFESTFSDVKQTGLLLIALSDGLAHGGARGAAEHDLEEGVTSLIAYRDSLEAAERKIVELLQTPSELRPPVAKQTGSLMEIKQDMARMRSGVHALSARLLHCERVGSA